MIFWSVAAFVGLIATSGSGRKTDVDTYDLSIDDVSQPRVLWDEPLPDHLTNVQGQSAPSKFLPHGSSTTDLADPSDDEQWVRRTLSLVVNATTDMYNHISVDVAYNSLFGEVVTFPERRPRMFNVMLATIKAMLADLIVQTIEQKTSRRHRVDIDWWRVVAFALFGLFYEGLVSWFLYVTVFAYIFPGAITFANSPLSMKFNDYAGQRQVFGQVLLDNLVYTAFAFFPVFYIIKEAVTHYQQPSRITDKAAEPVASRVVRSALRNYLNNIKEDNLTSCALWIPMDIVMFSLPMFLRMPFGHCIGFSWMMILSSMRGALH